MKRLSPVLLFLAILSGFLPAKLYAAEKDAFFLSNPCLSPDGAYVVFVFEGDLWRASTKGGQATRLTAMPGYESNPRWSPDGKWIAFTGRQTGNADLYIMPAEGGDIRQLTYHSGSDELSSWSWDSKTLYFTSGRMGQQSGFTVPITGGTPVRVFGSYFFQYDHNLYPHPTTGEIFFNDTWESSNQLQRKHYKGPFNPDIESYNPATKQFKRYTDYAGKDFGASVDKKGNVYFMSDEGNGEYNLYTLRNGKKTVLTDFKNGIKSALVSADGGSVVFEKDYQLYLYDVAGGSSHKLEITITRNYMLPQEKDFDVKGNVSNFDVSPDGKKLAFVARGELFVSDVEGKFIRHIEKGSEERANEVKWLADNKTLLFSQTLGGYLNLYTVAADGSAAVKQITSDARGNRSLDMNKGRSKALYLSGRDELRVLDCKTFESKLIVKDEFWAMQSSDAKWSPDGGSVAYTAHRNFEEDIFVYNVASGKSTNLTNTGVAETDPVWAPDGKYIYFSSSRLKPSYPFGPQDPKIYRIALQKYDEPFRSDKFDDLFKKDSTKKDSAAPVKIDTEHIFERIEQVSGNYGSHYMNDIIGKGGKTFVLYSSNQDGGKFGLFKTTLEPFESNKTEKITGADGIAGQIVVSGDKYFMLQGGVIYKMNLDQNKLDPIATSLTFRRDMAGEFKQMFYEGWAKVEENYYDDHFHGLDWKATRDRYAAYLPNVNNRADLRTLMNDMLGELNSSHQGFYSFGKDEEVPYAARTMETGIIWDEKEPYKVKYVVRRSAADKESVHVSAGDELVEVGGVKVDPSRDRNYYFTKPSMDRELTMVFSSGSGRKVVEVHPQGSLYDNLYDEWIDKNRERVNQKSGGKIAYSCMKNMGTEELESFVMDMTHDHIGKDGLILDIRYNTGGNVHDEVLRFLQQRSYLRWKYRGGQLTEQSNFAPSDKPIILLTNEQSLSDAEMTSAGFKALKLGKIVGNETYHWIIFTSGAGLVDGSFVRLPSWGCYTLDGKDLEQTGVSPDIKVLNTFEDKINGRDPQLDKAIEEILNSKK